MHMHVMDSDGASLDKPPPKIFLWFKTESRTVADQSYSLRCPNDVETAT